jgi:hypothetical protein
MMDFIGAHSAELAAAVMAIFMLVLGYIGIEDAVKHRAD